MVDLARDSRPSGRGRVVDLREKVSAFGNSLSALKTELSGRHSDRLVELDQRYAALQRELESFEAREREASDRRSDDEATMERMKAQAKETWAQTQTVVNKAYDDLKTYATDERNAEALRGSAKDVGEGLSQAWNDMAAAFDKAINRFRKSGDQDATGDAGRPSERPEPREQPLKQLNKSQSGTEAS